jgi:hypothetical protein
MVCDVANGVGGYSKQSISTRRYQPEDMPQSPTSINFPLSLMITWRLSSSYVLRSSNTYTTETDSRLIRPRR